MTTQSDARIPGYRQTGRIEQYEIDGIERSTREYLSELSRDPNTSHDFQNYLTPADVLALVAECRRLRAERGRLVNTTKHRDVTLETWERPNELGASDGGE